MRIALVDSTPRPKKNQEGLLQYTKRQPLYSLPLLKLGAWCRDQGDECELFEYNLPAAGEFDEIWITTLFTYHIYEAAILTAEAVHRAKKVKVGGVAATLLPDYFKRDGVEIHLGLHWEAERYRPDYTLLKRSYDYSITHASRGCVRKCKFCMVSRLEPKFRNRREWIKDLNPEADKILFYDNNWLAKDMKALEYDTARIRELQSEGKIREVDFNQGLDARLMTEEKAKLLEGLEIYPLRFAFDNMGLDGIFQNTIRMMARLGFSSFSYYALYNYKDTPEDLYYRLKQGALLREELNVEVPIFPMRYHPILDVISGRDYVGRHWNKAALKGFEAIKNQHSVHGQVSTKGGSVYTPVEEFEFWFGRDEKEFVRLINYPKIRLLARRKKSDLRIRRAQAKEKEARA